MTLHHLDSIHHFTISFSNMRMVTIQKFRFFFNLHFFCCSVYFRYILSASTFEKHDHMHISCMYMHMHMHIHIHIHTCHTCTCTCTCHMHIVHAHCMHIVSAHAHVHVWCICTIGGKLDIFNFDFFLCSELILDWNLQSHKVTGSKTHTFCNYTNWPWAKWVLTLLWLQGSKSVKMLMYLPRYI